MIAPAPYPFTRYRPVKTDTGGGSSEALTDPVVIYGSAPVFKDGETILEGVDVYEDVLVGDIVVLQEE